MTRITVELTDEQQDTIVGAMSYWLDQPLDGWPADAARLWQARLASVLATIIARKYGDQVGAPAPDQPSTTLEPGRSETQDTKPA